MKNQSGIITVEFLFSIMLSFTMVLVVFALTYTLSTVEITQYIVFSAARAQSAGNLDPDAQQKAARTKYDLLVGNPLLRALYQGAFFAVSDSKKLEVRAGISAGTGNFDKDYPAKSSTNREIFQGVRTDFTAKILNLRVPFLGSISVDDEGFKTRIATIMLREPSMQECTQFMKQRMTALWTIDNGRANAFKGSARKMPTAWEDNGC